MSSVAIAPDEVKKVVERPVNANGTKWLWRILGVVISVGMLAGGHVLGVTMSQGQRLATVEATLKTTAQATASDIAEIKVDIRELRTMLTELGRER